jgi:hypothetical protein
MISTFNWHRALLLTVALLAGCGQATGPIGIGTVDVIGNLPGRVGDDLIDYKVGNWQAVNASEPTEITAAMRVAGIDPAELRIAVGFAGPGPRDMVTAWRVPGMAVNDLRDAAISQWSFGKERRWTEGIAGRTVLRVGPEAANPTTDLYVIVIADTVVMVVTNFRNDAEELIAALPG